MGEEAGLIKGDEEGVEGDEEDRGDEESVLRLDWMDESGAGRGEGDV